MRINFLIVPFVVYSSSLLAGCKEVTTTPAAPNNQISQPPSKLASSGTKDEVPDHDEGTDVGFESDHATVTSDESTPQQPSPYVKIISDLAEWGAFIPEDSMKDPSVIHHLDVVATPGVHAYVYDVSFAWLVGIFNPQYEIMRSIVRAKLKATNSELNQVFVLLRLKSAQDLPKTLEISETLAWIRLTTLWFELPSDTELPFDIELQPVYELAHDGDDVHRKLALGEMIARYYTGKDGPAMLINILSVGDDVKPTREQVGYAEEIMKRPSGEKGLGIKIKNLFNQLINPKISEYLTRNKIKIDNPKIRQIVQQILLKEGQPNQSESKRLKTLVERHAAVDSASGDLLIEAKGKRIPAERGSRIIKRTDEQAKL